MRQFVQHKETYAMRSFFIFFPLGFSEFLRHRQYGMSDQGGVLGNRRTHHVRVPPFLGVGVFPLDWSSTLAHLPPIYTHVLY